MAVPDTPQAWFAFLAAKIDKDRDRVTKARDYTSGRVPLPEMDQNARETWRLYQRKARVDYGGLAVKSLLGRIVPNGIRAGDSGSNQVVTACRRIWRDNRFDVVAEQAIDNMIVTGRGYLRAGVGDDGEARLFADDPVCSWADPEPERPWKARAFLTAWRDRAAGIDVARLFADGQSTRYTRPQVDPDTDTPITTVAGGGWTEDPDGTWTYAGGVPVAILDQGHGFIEPHHDLLDQLIEGKLQRLCIVAKEAFIQRAIKGNLKKKDEKGNDIDWSKAFPSIPGSLWNLPEGIDIWESRTTDLTPILEGEKSDARTFAAVTSTPIHVLSPESANQSAEGAATAKEGQVNNAKRVIRIAKPAIELAFVYALRCEAIDVAGLTVEALFENPEHVSLSEKADAALKAKSGGLSTRTVKRDIWGMTPEAIAQDEADARQEMLKAAILAQQMTLPAATRGPVA